MVTTEKNGVAVAVAKSEKAKLPAGKADKPPKYAVTYCSQCGKVFGAGDSGFSACKDHA